MKHLITALSLGVITWSAQAATYQSVQPQTSRIAFTYHQMGVAMQGQFKRFKAQIHLDTQRPSAAQGSLDIDLASIDTGSAEANTEVVGKDWFNTAQHPQARFVLQSLQDQGAGRYLATGQLRIKDHTRTLQASMRLSPQGLLDGQLVIRRADFGVGVGMWSAFDIVANDITVQFTLQLK